MRKLLSPLLVVVFLVAGVLLPVHASAAINYNRLIDDFVFSNSSKMSAAQIDSFLNSFPSSCISTHKGFKAPDPTGYNPADGFLYGGNVSAGKVIYDAAQAYDLNPQVLLATLQKEQGYVSGPGFYDCTNPLSSSAKKGYTQAMGYGCPDGGTTYSYSGVNLYTIGSTTVTSVSGTCVNSKSKAGFSQQMIHAAWLLKFGQQRSLGNTSWAIIKGSWDNSDDPGTCYGGPMTQGYRKRCSSDTSTVYYDGYTTIDGSSVHMDTGATAALYWYTPHKAGNLNFVNLFVGWFGSTLANPVRIKVIDGSTSESGGTATVEFSLVSQPSGSVTVPLSISNPSEGTLSGIGSITITMANWNNPSANLVTITGVDDNIPDGDISYKLLTGDPSSSDAAYDNLGQSDVPDVVLVNTDNEPDVPLVGDWNGDGKADIGLKRGKEYLLNYGHDGQEEVRFTYGLWTDTPIVGDWNGDGKADIGLKRGNQYFLNYGHDGTADKTFTYGKSSDVAFGGKWCGGKKSAIGLKRGNVYILNCGLDGTAEISFSYGKDTDTPIVGDWDKDGIDEIGLWRDKMFYLNYGNDGTEDFSFSYGKSTDTPLGGDWDGDGRGEVGVKRGNTFYLNYNTDSTADAIFSYGR